MMLIQLPPEAEAQALERLKRAIAHEKAKTNDFLSLRPQSRLIIGLSASFRAVQNGKAKLVIVPGKIPPPAVQVLIEVAERHKCPIWTPSHSSVGFGRFVGLNRSPCVAAAFVGEGDSADSLTSIRDFVVNHLSVSESQAHDAKKLKLDKANKG